jgi:prophage regulatory protein
MSDRLVREEECRRLTGLSRATRWRKERAGTFPKRYRISAGITAYRESEIIDWLDSCFSKNISDSQTQ